jgi:Tfp pilus assembly protein PilN
VLPTRDSVKKVAAIHHRGDGLSIVMADLGPDGPGVTSAQTVPAPGAGATLASLLPPDSVDLLIQVLPASRTVARAVAPPMAEGDERPSENALADAMALIAESDLPSSLPPFRRAAGVLRPGKGGRPVGVLTGWPESAEGDLAVPRVAPVIGVAEPAALAMLAQLVGGVRSAIASHPASGSLAVLCVGDERTILRATRLAPEAAAEAAPALVAETAAAAGVAPPRPDAHAHVALDPAPSAPRLGGGTRDGGWVEKYGVALAAIAIYADPSPAVHALAGLYEVEPKTEPNAIERITGWLGTPARAAAVIGACVLALGVVPIGVAWARGAVLEKSVKDERSLLEQNAADERELAFYRLLREKRWPMTRLLADLSGACPVGITLDSIDLSQGDSALSVRGTADTSDLLTTFRENLGRTGVFRDVTTPSTSPTAGGVQFQLTAKVPPGVGAIQPKPIDDFAAKPLVERLYGESGPGPRNRPARADRGNRGSSNHSAASSSPSRGSDNTRPGTTARSETRPSGPSSPPKEPLVIPPPLTDAQIAKMTGEEAMKEFGVRRKASVQAGLDADTKRRLADEAEKARARMREAMSGGGK